MIRPPPPTIVVRPGAVRRAGFTLIEVLVSLAIFAIAAVILGATYVNVLASYDAVARRSEHEQELRFVRAVILGEPDRMVVEEGGDLPLPENRSAHWGVTLEQAAVADLFQVHFRCEIRDPARAEPWVREENFMLLRPTWSDPVERDKLRQSARERLETRRRQ